MKKIDKTVIKETIYIASFTLILSVLLQSIFLIIKRWDYTILLGNVIGYVAAVLNFFLMGLTVQKAVLLDAEDAKKRVKLSQMLRMLMLVVFAVIVGIFNEQISIVTFAIPLLFPRIAITFRPFFDKNKKN